MTETPPKPPHSKEQPDEIRKIRSDELFQGARILVITHAGTEYRLIKTRNDKLMLQK